MTEYAFPNRVDPEYVLKNRVTGNVHEVGPELELHKLAQKLNERYQSDEWIVEPFDRDRFP